VIVEVKKEFNLGWGIGLSQRNKETRWVDRTGLPKKKRKNKKKN